MTFIVGQACINCKHTDCVEVCPVDCFYEGENTLVIDPEAESPSVINKVVSRRFPFFKSL